MTSNNQKKLKESCHRLTGEAVGVLTARHLEGVNRKLMMLAGLLFLVACVAVVAIARGNYEISIPDVIRALAGNAAGNIHLVVMNIRLPRVVAALLCGWGLAVSGLAIQSLLKNPLGSPITLGISHGAAFGAAAAIVIFGAEMSSVTVFACAGGVAATAVILVLSRFKRLSPTAIILVGVAMQYLFLSGTYLIQYYSSETDLVKVVFWSFGDVARSNWREIWLLAGAVVSASVFMMVLRWDFNALAVGDETAKGLGVSVEKIRLIGLTVATLVAALATAFHGIIGFIGLIAPHMAQRLVGDDHSLLVPFSAVLGALLLLLSDTLGRVLIGSGSLPVGVITAFLGAPIFLYLLVRNFR